MLNGKNILLGLTGSIAVYKSIDLVRGMIKEGANVTVVMTEAASRFVTPLTFETVTGRSVHIDTFESPLSHINLPRDTELFIIAPATANTISKLASGIADNLLSNIYLAYKGPVLIAPAMNYRMYENPIIKENILRLEKTGVKFVGPEAGSLACGEEGVGRMSEAGDLLEAVRAAFTQGDLSGHNILVTAGPTREAIDPVRFISNRSSGKMGFAVAAAALKRGAKVTLVSGPSSEHPPQGASFVSVESASQMRDAVMQHIENSTAVIMAAAVADFSPVSKSETKIKKADSISIELQKTPDILQEVGGKKGSRILIGFAAETGKNTEKAKKKLKDKNLDLIVLNDVTQKGAGFDVDTNIVTIIGRGGEITDYPLMKKMDVANIIIDRMLQLKMR
ncbi:MAG: bifunctional phosphopantothenoylcysteine decarboxylase/phosphopantothenate--cysteine ligase CoaBC [Nitrospirae bacterium]|nr:bifunctional phosphopantothenoylcysteine decarboxylase/phosphopantothenate--cysteine ligase CoaBC [Nitrospirota bacterium]